MSARKSRKGIAKRASLHHGRSDPRRRGQKAQESKPFPVSLLKKWGFRAVG